MDTLAEFEAGIETHRAKLFGAAYRYTRNQHDAEDLLQDTLLRAYSKLDSYEAGTNLRGWLHTIMFHAFASQYRAGYRDPLKKLRSAYDEGADEIFNRINISAPSAESEALKTEYGPAMTALKNMKHPQFREAVYLADVEGYHYKEVARIMGTSIGTVMSRIHRGRKQLRKQLQEVS